jgi:hypothetical protein
MENDGPKVDLATEPKIETRFGFAKDGHSLSSKTIKYCALGTSVALVGLFLMKSPDKPEQENPGVRPPDASPTTQSSDQMAVDSYSAAQESEHIKEQNKKRSSRVVVRFPGLQKIDRRKAGDIPPGSMVKAVLVTGASNGPVRIETKETLRIQGETLIPEGATLLGTGQSTEERLMVHFTQIVFKDGSYASISAQAADVEDKTVGLRGSRVGRVAMKYAAAIGLNFVGGMADGLQDREIVGQAVVTKPDARNALLSGTSRATLEMANETMSDLKNKAPIIQIDAGKEILVIFDGGQ